MLKAKASFYCSPTAKVAEFCMDSQILSQSGYAGSFSSEDQGGGSSGAGRFYPED